ncbi:hypothetical protein [Tautonia plasticadhaerens]|uniref:Uncharacterized protein n=1 Tax=Tautonia plasticadhaerens TaxID=2527974 RepID=A0A518GV73_9BACT|nr:hypothetical protein [Tautonia plasticadhaerens]QDV32487.1 hypothetical protein ElP_03200 [Tautonia plasticadhaerens]
MPPPESNADLKLDTPWLLGSMTADETRAWRWLGRETPRLSLFARDELPWLLWREVPGSERLSDIRMRLLFDRWALANGLPLMPLPWPRPLDLFPPPLDPSFLPPPPTPNLLTPPKIPAAPTSGDSKFAEYFKALANIPTEVTVVKGSDGQVTLGIGGLTADLKTRHDLKLKGNVAPGGAEGTLKKGDFSSKVTAGWDGKLTLGLGYRGVSLGGEVGPEKWSTRIGFRLGPGMPDLSQLGTLFTGAVDSFGAVASAADRFTRHTDPGRLVEEVKPHLDPLKKAGKAVQQVSKSKSGQLSFEIGVGLGGATTGPDAGKVKPTVKGLLTYTF